MHLNAYCRNLNSIKTDCKCQLLGCTLEKKKRRISIRKIGMEMRKLFSNSGAEINKKEIAALVVLLLFVFFFIGPVCTITYEPIYSQRLYALF